MPIRCHFVIFMQLHATVLFEASAEIFLPLSLIAERPEHSQRCESVSNTCTPGIIQAYVMSCMHLCVLSIMWCLQIGWMFTVSIETVSLDIPTNQIHPL